MSAPSGSRPSTRANPRPAATSTANSSMRKGRRRTPSTTAATTPAPERRRGSDSLTRNDLPDIVAAVLDALPNATATTPARSSRLATQPANPPNQLVTPEEEQQHQEIALDQVPTANQLHLVQQIGDPPTSSSYPMPSCSTTVPTLPPCEKTSTPLYIGGGMPPIPAKLAKRIQEGLFVEMVELMPDYLRSPNPSDEDQFKNTKPKNWEITNIVDWIQCFSLYIAVVCRSQPQRIADLLGYQNLIITSHQRFPDFNWATYDREFRQQAAARTIPDWSVLDNTLWNLARQSTTQFTRQPYKFQQTEKTYRSQLPPQ